MSGYATAQGSQNGNGAGDNATQPPSFHDEESLTPGEHVYSGNAYLDPYVTDDAMRAAWQADAMARTHESDHQITDPGHARAAKKSKEKKMKQVIKDADKLPK